MRLIDADGLSKSIYDNVSAPYEDAVAAKEDCLRAIEEAPTIDAVPVVHGEWAPSGENPGFLVCSACEGCYVVDEWADGKKWRYCPACGAKMDGKGEEA